MEKGRVRIGEDYAKRRAGMEKKSIERGQKKRNGEGKGKKGR